MKLTNKVLANAENGLKFLLANPNKNAYIKMRSDADCRYIDYIVEKGNYYFCGNNEDAYVYWDNNSYGFTFSPDIFEIEKESTPI